jgi:quercetin dioxygenase-like cupin family protein
MASEQSTQAPRPLPAGTIAINLHHEISRLKSTSEWRSGDRHAVSLIKNAPLNLLLMVLKKGAKLHEHRTKGPIAVQVVSGSIRFSAGTEYLLSAGEIVGLDRNIAHSIESVEESAIILVTAID